jgi:hypothetical protein
MKTTRQLRAGFCTVAVGFLCQLLLHAETNAPAISVHELLPNAVRVEILEGLPDQPGWNFTNPPVSETYTEPGFGFVVLPTKYSPKGIKVDRRAPFLLRAAAKVTLPPGEQRILFRARTGARLFLDGKQLLTIKFPSLISDGHEEVPEVPLPLGPDVRYVQPGQSEAIATVQGDGAEHVMVVETVIGVKDRRPEISEMSVSLAEKGAEMFYVLVPNRGPRVALSDDAWLPYADARREHHAQADAERRRTLAKSEDSYWAMRHERAREQAAKLPAVKVPRVKNATGFNDIDRFINAKLETASSKSAPLVDDYAFLRRLALDTIGRVPTVEELNQFLGDSAKDRRAKAIDRFLQHPGWADHWVSYWQDVLAENPGILKPMLNNTGPFRWYVHEAFSDNKPMDRFATELILMEGSSYYGGPAGFGVATENDVPMAQKAQIIAQAFMGMQMQCARCHDAPYHDFKQRDLFSLAAMLKRAPQEVPLSSSIPTNANIVIGRVVKVTLKPGSKVEPVWTLTNTVPDELAADVLRNAKDSRERLAALISDPRNERFARVIVNRLWKQFLGKGIVEPVDDWETAKASHPELLDWLARELTTHDYDLKHLARLILNSHTYQREARPDAPGDQPEQRLFTGPSRRRMSAEQIVDSLFSAVGKKFESEEMNMDVDGRRPVREFNNLGTPYHSWEFTSLSNERDRPALAMPRAQMISDTLSTFGWRESRQGPQTLRDESPNVLQPAAIANGLLANGRITRLSDDSALTALATRGDVTLPQLTRETFLRLASRPPTPAEEKVFASYLKDGFDSRLAVSENTTPKQRKATRPVSWSNHLNPEATKIKLEAERAARAGDPPTERIATPWRERMEDAVWALVNSPEFMFVP